VTDYFEWIGAGSVEVVPVGDAMHEVSVRAGVISSVEFGFDPNNLYVKVAGPLPMRDVIVGDQQLSLNFLKPEGCRIVVSADGATVRAEMKERPRGGRDLARTCPDINVAAGRLLELQVPFQCLGVTKDATVAFMVAINLRGAEVEHHPRNRAIEVEVPDERFPSRNWTA
jgi:hypothetical protein